MTLHHELRAAAGNSSGPTDPNFENVTLLLHGDGTNGAQNNTFLDSSTNNFTITRNGNTTQGSFSPYGDLWSNYFDGSGDYLTVPGGSAFALGTTATIEFWIYQKARGSALRILSTYNQLSGIDCYVDSDGTLKTHGGLIVASYIVPLNTWVNIALVYNSGTLTIYADGISKGSGTGVNITSTNTLFIGTYSGGGYDWDGYISNLRIVKGTALYTSNFTPSTTPLTAISGTSLLTCQSNRFKDNSSNNFTITKYGDTKVTNFSPFSPSSAYSPAVNGGSGYFDGSEDYLSTPSSGQFAPSGDFTIGLWYYPTTTNTYQQIIGNFASNTPATWVIEVENGTAIWFYTNGTTRRIGGAGVTVNAWNYIALVRSGSTITGYVNGASIGTYSQSGVFGSASVSISIGRGGDAKSSDMATGYISNVRLVDGSAITTVPTTPLTAITNTILLCNFTNAGIYDNSMKNDLETVGNAQISTSVKKFGTGSMSFGASAADSLVVNGDPNGAVFGTNDFTIELWFYSSSTAGYHWIISPDVVYTTSNYYGLSVDITTGYAVFGNAVTNWLSGITNVCDSTWNHIAVSRSGSTARLFVNGTQQASTTLTASLGVSGAVRIGSYRGTNYPFNGYIDDLRITKGVARYTANFTPPTQAFPNQ